MACISGHLWAAAGHRVSRAQVAASHPGWGPERLIWGLQSWIPNGQWGLSSLINAPNKVDAALKS